MSCYFIAQINIHDKNEYEKYLKGYDDIFNNYKGEVIAVDDEPTTLEGEWPYNRSVIIRFPDKKEARKWYDSVEYQALARYRREASSADIILVEGRK